MSTSYCFWLRGEAHAELAKLSIESVHKIDPGARVYAYTDEPDTTPHVPGALRCVLPSGRPAMVANLDAQISLLGTIPYGDRVLFLDADTLMREAFPWDNSSDLYVTWRDHVNGDREMAKHQPINYGVLGCVSNARTFEAFLWLRARILQMAPKHQLWYGNQLAIADLVTGWRQPHSEARIRWTLTDTGTAISVRALPCETWNYSPNAENEDVTGKGILHLKGDRKDLMQHYAVAA